MLTAERKECLKVSVQSEGLSVFLVVLLMGISSHSYMYTYMYATVQIYANLSSLGSCCNSCFVWFSLIFIFYQYHSNTKSVELANKSSKIAKIANKQIRGKKHPKNSNNNNPPLQKQQPQQHTHTQTTKTNNNNNNKEPETHTHKPQQPQKQQQTTEVIISITNNNNNKTSKKCSHPFVQRQVWDLLSWTVILKEFFLTFFNELSIKRKKQQHPTTHHSLTSGTTATPSNSNVSPSDHS